MGIKPHVDLTQWHGRIDRFRADLLKLDVCGLARPDGNGSPVSREQAELFDAARKGDVARDVGASAADGADWGIGGDRVEVDGLAAAAAVDVDREARGRRSGSRGDVGKRQRVDRLARGELDRAAGGKVERSCAGAVE